MRRSARASLVAALLITSGASLAGVASAQDLMDYRVRSGDTCRSIATRVYGDSNGLARLHEHNPQLGPTPHHLEPGSVLHLPRPAPPAHLTAVHRVVEQRAPEASTFRGARAGEALPRGTQVRTHEASSAEITFEDQAQVTVRERTLVIVYGGQRRLVERAITRAELERGALRSRLGELAGRRPLEIDTPTAQASLDGDAVVSVEEDGTSRVSNHSRRPATVLAGGRRVRLPAGTGTVVRRGAVPTAPRELLLAPRWRADRSGPVLGFVGRGAILRGGFDPVEGAARYRIEISRRPEGAELVHTLELGGDARSFEAAGLDEGTVYVSVASIDEAGLEGRRSPWRAFSVRLARLVEPGGGQAPVEEDVPRVWPGTWLVAPRGLDCADTSDHPRDGAAGEDGEGSEASGILTLRYTGTRAIVCRDRSGNEASLAVEVVRSELDAPDRSVVRDRTTPIAFAIASERTPPARVLVVEAPEGFRASAPRARAGAIVVDVWASPDAPDTATLVVSVAAGTERIRLGTIALEVRDAGPAARPEEALPPPPRARLVQGALGDLAWPSALALRDERAGGVGAWLSVAPVESSGDVQLRVGAGARAQIPDTPLRLGFASQLDPLGSSALVDRRGDADLLLSIGALLVDEGALGAALDFGAWIPTRAEPESLGRVRLAPSLELSVRPVEWLALRTRQGAIVDATSDGARLWAGAIGVDVSPIEWLAIGLELDAAAGVFVDRSGAALSLGGGVEARWGLLELALGARFALTDEARDLHGAWSLIATVRVFSR